LSVGIAIGGEPRDIDLGQEPEPVKLGSNDPPFIGGVTGDECRRTGAGFGNLRFRLGM
jgi:hypothetical protein